MVCMVYVNFITTVITVSQKIIGDITFVPPLVLHINSSSTQFLFLSFFKEKYKNARIDMDMFWLLSGKELNMQVMFPVSLHAEKESKTKWGGGASLVFYQKQKIPFNISQAVQ